MPLSRRTILSSGVAGGILAATAAAASEAKFGNPDQPAEGAINVANPKALTDPGPQDQGLAGNEPTFLNPPATDVNGMPQFWTSFNLAPKRIQNGGWARQITQDDFKISTTIAGVNMRLGPGGVRELHWHQQAEWAVMTHGNCRVTVLDESGRSQVADVREGDLWYFPAGFPHSLQGLGPDGCEFVIAFDNGDSSEFNTLLVTDWLAHTPPEVVAKNFGQPVEAFKNLPVHNKWIYQSNIAAPPLETVEAQMAATAGKPPNSFVFRLGDVRPNRETKSGVVRIADSSNFTASKTVAATMVTIKPGGLRDMHWHPNADEWSYWIKGSGRMTVFNTGPAAITADFHPGDVGYVKKGLGHYVENTGATDLVYMEVFRAERFQEVSLSDWLAHSPIDMVAETLNLDPSVIRQFPKDRPDIVPAK
ncbi:oxalate decarboxylase [Bradyrhizobium elkanii]|uniref:cupin domain-containing protein n=1 Tax=Bradyrhizobium elkanii TaxID=29448 RepID=UPI002227C0CD|nr:cupin domain-containing protein [Bradyrhizobium elkanii]MCW2124928.1 oxalate decarboxylase [Bradyrhizobium elkanii]MCW2171674.1 oxalate decarboxylase [Bradyrhizobium elkanii]